MERAVGELRTTHPGCTILSRVSGDLRGSWDEHRCAQIVRTLTSNAIQQGPRGKEVRVLIHGGPDAVQLAVINSGVVPDDRIDTLFDPFQGGDPTAVRRRDLGLGLYIAQQIVLAHGGSISVKSEDDETRVEVTLPRAPECRTEA